MTLLIIAVETPKSAAKIKFSNICILAVQNPVNVFFSQKRIIQNKAEKILYVDSKCAHIKLKSMGFNFARLNSKTFQNCCH